MKHHTLDHCAGASAIPAALRKQIAEAIDAVSIKLGSGMAPSPFAQRLIEDVRPILRSIRQAISPPEPFDPATSRRVLYQFAFNRVNK